jgi:hypothetical protein
MKNIQRNSLIDGNAEKNESSRWASVYPKKVAICGGVEQDMVKGRVLCDVEEVNPARPGREQR